MYCLNPQQLPDKCCQWVCLEDLHPVGGDGKHNFGHGTGGGGPVINVRYTPGNGADIGLRLVRQLNLKAMSNVLYCMNLNYLTHFFIMLCFPFDISGCQLCYCNTFPLLVILPCLSTAQAITKTKHEKSYK